MAGERKWRDGDDRWKTDREVGMSAWDDDGLEWIDEEKYLQEWDENLIYRERQEKERGEEPKRRKKRKDSRKQKSKRKWKILKVISTCTLMFFMSIIGYAGYYLEKKVPDQISIVADQEEKFFLGLPIRSMLVSDSAEVAIGNGSNIPSDAIKLDKNDTVSLYSEQLGSYRLGLHLFGMQVKEIQVDVVKEQQVIPCGLPVGIYLKSDGVMVIGTGEIINSMGEVEEPALGILKSGDYIRTVNGIEVTTQDDLFEALEKNGKEQAKLGILRDQEQMTVNLDPVEAEDGKYKLGVWVREDTQGIGTVTYVDQNGGFGALGHGISDSDTGEVVQIVDGTLYNTEIMGIEKGKAGNPGVMSGVIYYGNQSKIGNINKNTPCGIFGTVNNKFKRRWQGEKVELGFKQEIEKGAATIVSAVSGELKEYDIEILKIDTNASNNNKGLVIKVTDPALLELTGGIIQGMSGSPIIQNNKLVGAVTHVFVNDPTRGYGIFIENMLEAAE